MYKPSYNICIHSFLYTLFYFPTSFQNKKSIQFLQEKIQKNIFLKKLKKCLQKKSNCFIINTNKRNHLQKIKKHFLILVFFIAVLHNLYDFLIILNNKNLNLILRSVLLWQQNL